MKNKSSLIKNDMENVIKITSRHMSLNGELILKVMLSGCQLFHDKNCSYNRNYELDDCPVIIIDIDNSEGKLLWHKLDFSGDSIIKIAYTAKPENYPNESYFLKKPIRYNELNRLVGDLKPVIKKDSSNITAVNDNLKEENQPSILLETVLNNRDKIIQLYTEAETIIIDSNRLLYFGSSDEEMEIILASDSSFHEIVFLENSIIDLGNESYDLSNPLIKVISQRFNGKLLSRLNDRDHFKLARWPNFKKNRYNPTYVKIAVALSNKFSDIASVVKLCKVSYEEVVVFINICYALNNLVVQTNAEPVATKNLDSKKRKEPVFLAKIRNRLGI